MPELQHHNLRTGIKQHWVGVKDGPPAVLLHGFPEIWYTRRKRIPILAEC